MNQALKLKTFKNIGYNAFAKGIVFVLQVPTQIILARQLTSDDYGIVGFAMIFINFLTHFSDLGIKSAIIRKIELDEKELYTAFTIKMVLGLLVFVLAFFLAPIANILFNNAVGNVIKLLSLNFIINSFIFLPDTILTRELNYKILSLFQVTLGIATSGFSLLFALEGFGYWSVVAAYVCAMIISAIFINIVKPVKIKFCFEKKAASEFLCFGSRLFFTGMIGFLIFNFDNFTIGTVNGSQTLGYYSVSFAWGSLICNIAGTVINSVLLPTFSKIQNDKERLKKTYLEVMSYISFIVILINISLFIISKEFLFIILGKNTDKWLPALTCFKILCLYGILRALLEPIGCVIIAIGKANIMLKSSLVVGILELIVVYPVLRYFSIEGVAIAVAIVYSLQYFIYFHYFREEIGLCFQDLIKPLKPAFVSALFVVCMFSVFTYENNEYALVLLSLKLFLIIAGYLAIYGIITKWKLFKEIKYIIGNMHILSRNI